MHGTQIVRTILMTGANGGVHFFGRYIAHIVKPMSALWVQQPINHFSGSLKSCLNPLTLIHALKSIAIKSNCSDIC